MIPLIAELKQNKEIRVKVKNEIINNLLDYSQHIDYFEDRITWKKEDIERELKNDFMDEYY